MKVVLVAEDEANLRDIITQIFEGFDIPIVTVHNGKEAVEFVEAGNEISIVLLDKNMPIMSGIAAYHRIRELKPEITILFVTGLNDFEDNEAISKDMRSLVIQKPFNYFELVDIVKRIIGNQER
jgi:CheY-like chemotaxis protein